MRNKADHAAIPGYAPALETNMVFRAAAILAVVAGHSQLLDIRGGAAFLLALAGFNFRRFKLRSFLRDDSPWPSTLRYERKILLPYLVALIAYFAWKGVLEWDMLFLYSNLLRVDGTAIFPAWFIQVLVQCTLIIAVIFSFRRVRDLATKPGIALPLVMVGIGATISLASDHFLDLHHLLRRTPLRFFGLVTLGWACAAARTPRERSVMIVVSCAYAAIVLGLNSVGVWVTVGMAAILICPALPAPDFVTNAVNTTARASYYIFLLHMTALHAVGMAGIDSPIIRWVSGVGLGLIGWFVFDRLLLHRVLLQAAGKAGGRMQGRFARSA